MFLREELQKYAKNSNFESALYSISGRMPLTYLYMHTSIFFYLRHLRLCFPTKWEHCTCFNPAWHKICSDTTFILKVRSSFSVGPNQMWCTPIKQGTSCTYLFWDMGDWSWHRVKNDSLICWSWNFRFFFFKHTRGSQ